MWIARDKAGNPATKNDTLHLFLVKPIRCEEGYWHTDDWEYPESQDMCLPKSLVKNFDFLTWEHDPIEVELVSSMLNSVQEKLAESVDEYFDYVGHVQDIHPYSKEKEQNLYDKMCWRWQDWGDIKYDNPSTWDLNFDDYGKEKNI